MKHHSPGKGITENPSLNDTEGITVAILPRDRYEAYNRLLFLYFGKRTN